MLDRPGLASDFLVDWTWYSSVGFFGVFWTIIGAKIALFVAVFVATATVIWVNGALASRVARAARLSAVRSNIALGIAWQQAIAGGDRAFRATPALAPARRSNFCIVRRHARRPRLDRQLESGAQLHLSGAVWTKRSALRQ